MSDFTFTITATCGTEGFDWDVNVKIDFPGFAKKKAKRVVVRLFEDPLTQIDEEQRKHPTNPENILVQAAAGETPRFVTVVAVFQNTSVTKKQSFELPSYKAANQHG